MSLKQHDNVRGTFVDNCSSCGTRLAGKVDNRSINNGGQD